MRRSAVNSERGLAGSAKAPPPLPTPPVKTAAAKPAAKSPISEKRATFSYEKEQPFKIDELEALYFCGPENPKDVEFDFSQLTPEFLANLNELGLPRDAKKLPPRTLLPENFAWRSPSGVQRIPMLLAEFCAYKSALAYGESDKAVAENGKKEKNRLSNKLGGADDFRFFDTAGGVTDTQGFGCTYDGMIFLSMRGTEGPKGDDWDVNLSSEFTDKMQDSQVAKINELLSRFVPAKNWDADRAKKYLDDLAELVTRLQSRPGLHIGFAMAWEDVSGQVRQYIEDMKVKYGRMLPIVLTGHSLGGALATIGAYDLARRSYPVEAVVTFGAPCVGSAEFTHGYSSYKFGDYSLSDRTIRFVASGDAVPKALQRFYVRSMQALMGEEIRFDNVGNFLEFKGAPSKSIGLIEFAINNEMDRRKKAEEEKKKKEAEEAKKKTAGATGATASAQAADTGKSPKSGGKSNSALHVLAPLLICAGLMFTAPTFSFGGIEIAQVETVDRPAAVQDSPTGPAASTQAPAVETESDDIRVLWLVLAIFAVVFVIIFLLSRLQSHSVADRYALYLSTLAYQKIRSFRADSDETFVQRLAAANNDLERYLRFIRGDTGKEPSVAKMLDLLEAPPRLKDGIRLDIYQSISKDAHIF